MLTANKNKSNTYRLTALGILSAIIIVLQVFSTFVKFGPFSITLALIPIVIGAAMFGAGAGAYLGAVFSLVVLLMCIFGADLGGAMVWNANPLLCALLVMFKGTLAGFEAGVHYRALSDGNTSRQIDLVKWDDSTISIRKRRILSCVLLSIITLGIYLIYWEYLLVKNIRAIKKDNSSCTGEMLCLIFVPFYSLYWWYTRGNVIKEELSAHGYAVSGSGIAYLILSLLRLDIVSLAIIQKDINSLPTDSIKTIESNNRTVATIVAALISPLVNTGVFVIGMMLFFRDTLIAWANGAEILYYIIFGMIGINFLVEVAVNVVLCPVVSKIMDAVKKSK